MSFHAEPLGWPLARYLPKYLPEPEPPEKPLDDEDIKWFERKEAGYEEKVPDDDDKDGSAGLIIIVKVRIRKFRGK